MIDTAKFKRFLHLTQQRKELKSQIDEINKELEPLALSLPDVLIEEEMTAMPLQGHLLHMVTRQSAKPKDGDKEAMLTALKENGFGSLFSVYSASLTALVKEFDESEEGRPQWLDDVIETSSTTKLQARKS